MSQLPPPTQSTGQKAANSGRSDEQQVAASISSEARTRLNISHEHASFEEGVWEYLASATFPVKDQSSKLSEVEFKHSLRFSADVAQMLRSGHFNMRDVEMDVYKNSNERRCERTTILRRRTSASTTSRVQYVNSSGNEEQIWKLVHEDLNALFRQYCEDYRHWHWPPAPPPADHDQEANDEKHRSGDSSHKTLQYARETTGTNLHSGVTGTQSNFYCTVINSLQICYEPTNIVVRWRTYPFTVS